MHLSPTSKLGYLSFNIAVSITHTSKILFFKNLNKDNLKIPFVRHYSDPDTIL